VPFVVLVGIYKLSPQFAHERGVSFNDFRCPADVLPYVHAAHIAAEGNAAAAARADSGAAEAPFVQALVVHNPGYDYVPPELISLLVTDHGHSFIPSYVYRQLSEFYHREDHELAAA
jgi:translation initiation factor eIF-2B subunit beta